MASGAYEWEECVNQVVVVGSPSSINEINSNWSTWLYRLSEINGELATFKSQIGQVFTGPAGEAYQTHLTGITEAIDQMQRDHGPIQELLSEAATTLSNAQASMPIPDAMLDDIEGRSAELNLANQRALSMASTAYFLLPGQFKEAIASTWAGDLARETFGRLNDLLNDWSNEQTEKANQVLSEVNNAQGGKAAATESPSSVTESPHNPESPDLSNFAPGGGGGGGVPSMGGGGVGGLGAGSVPPSSASSFDSPKNSFDGGTSGSGVGDSGQFRPPQDFETPGTGTSPHTSGLGASGVGGGGLGGEGLGSRGLGSAAGYDPEGSEYSPDDWNGTGLAGAGGGSAGLGSGGLGSGLGAPGGGLGSGAGGAGGGLGAGGAGAGLGGGALGAAGLGGAPSGAGAKSKIGKPVSMPMPPLGGVGGAAGGSSRGPGAGRGLAGTGAGMMGAGPGAGGLGGDGSSRDTWLREDEDVWGADGNTSSSWSWDDA